MKNEKIQTVILALALLWDVAVHDYQKQVVPEQVVTPSVLVIVLPPSEEPVCRNLHNEAADKAKVQYSSLFRPF